MHVEREGHRGQRGEEGIGEEGDEGQANARVGQCQADERRRHQGRAESLFGEDMPTATERALHLFRGPHPLAPQDLVGV